VSSWLKQLGILCEMGHIRLGCAWGTGCREKFIKLVRSITVSYNTQLCVLLFLGVFPNCLSVCDLILVLTKMS